ncbi:MAG TPA: FAD-dependent 5-carboxymethylaminomethyl-2-thiouridine(34) oxidoreductase MnmC [Burkholderiales bacterium]
MPEPILPARLGFHEGTPYSEAFADVYHSAAGGPEQARHVFLAGNGLPQRWAGRERFVILETGFGLGINFLATWQAWRRDPARCRRLHFVSIEKHPFELQDLRLLHQEYPQFDDEAKALHARWPVLAPGGHRLEFDGGRVVLTLFFADVKIARDLRLAADAIYLDGFSPAKNPDMWTPALMRSLSRLAARGGTAATWSVAGDVRRALQIAGFEVEIRAGFGFKKEMLCASTTKAKDPFLPKERKATVVGAGLAGAAVCERLCARGWEVELVERHSAPAQEASGNHAGTFHPVATPDDSLFARLTRSGFLYSLDRWRNLDGIRWDRCGVLQLARHDKELQSQQRSVRGLPPDYVQYVDRDEASHHAGVPVADGGLWFPEGGWIRPQTLVNAQLDACGSLLKRNLGVELKRLPANRTVILANSSEASSLFRVPHLRLRRVRGQLTYLPEDALEPPRVVVLRGGMILPPVDGLCVVGASFDLEDEDTNVRADSHAANLDRLKKILLLKTEILNPAGRVAFRSVTPDRLPVVGRLADNVYGAFAFGSRGLVWAALAAELLAAELEGEPLPVEGALVKALEPARFAKRAKARGSRP